MATERMRAGGQTVYTNQPGFHQSPIYPNPGPDVSVVQPETDAPTQQDAPEPYPEPTTSVELAGQDIVNTFADQNTSKETGANSPER